MPPPEDLLETITTMYFRERNLRRSLQHRLVQEVGLDKAAPTDTFLPVRSIRVDNARGTFLVCGSMASGDTTEKLEFEGTLQDTAYDRVHIKDFHQSWYCRGLIGLTDNRAETIAFLKDYLKDFPRPLTVVGSSSGAYAALLFGHRLNADRIIAFSPQTKLTRNIVNTFGAYRAGNTDFEINAIESDLRRLFEETPLSGTAELHFANKNALDKRQCKHLAGLPNVALVPYKFEGHNIARWLRNRDAMDAIFWPAAQSETSALAPDVIPQPQSESAPQ